MKNSEQHARIRQTVLAFALVASYGLAHPAHAAEKELNVYSWSSYLAKDTIANFQTQSGIHVRYDTYDDNNTLQTKLLSGNTGYDVVVPTSAFMIRQMRAGIFQTLDKAQIPNLKNVDPILMKKLAEGGDTGNQYAVPYTYGTDGIGYNVQAVKKALGENTVVDSWAYLFDPANAAKLKSCGISLLDQPGDAFAAALQYLRKSPATTNPGDIQAAFEVLKKIRPYVTQFNSSSYLSDLANGDVCIALGYSGDVGTASRRALEAKRPYEIRYATLKEGGLLWVDTMTVPKDAPHAQAAMQWINYILDPKVSASISNTTSYPTPVKSARALLKPGFEQDTAIYPTDTALDNTTLVQPLPQEITKLEGRLWAKLKSGQ